MALMPDPHRQAGPAELRTTRDTNTFYADGDPLRWVDRSIVDEIGRVCGKRLLDLGCGVGGYSRVLANEGFDVQALDVNPAYVAIARGLGVDARQYDGVRIPLADGAVETVFMVEVLEHVPQPERLIAEVARVASKNVVVTVPNNTQRFNEMIAWSHMLDVDHKNFFTVESLRSLLLAEFSSVEVRQVAAVDHLLAKDLLSRWPHRFYRLAVRLGLEKAKFHFRLIAVASR